MSELEQFLILAKTQKGRALDMMIQQVISHKKIFTFGELLAIPSVCSLGDGEFPKALHTLQLFAYGTYLDYVSRKDDYYYELTEAQAAKLRQLTIVSLAAQQKTIPYATLQHELQLESVRALEDVVIDAVYGGLLHARLDQRNRLLRVRNAARRDVPVGTGTGVEFDEMQRIIAKLTEWKGHCDDLVSVAQLSSVVVQKAREDGRQTQAQVQRAADDVKAALKESIAQGGLGGDTHGGGGLYGNSGNSGSSSSGGGGDYMNVERVKMGGRRDRGGGGGGGWR